MTLPTFIWSECCYPKYIHFQVKQGYTCFDLNASVQTLMGAPGGSAGQIAGNFLSSTMGKCKLTDCNDGKSHSGLYCGKGSCNIFGCNCDGGCIEGDIIQKFF